MNLLMSQYCTVFIHPVTQPFSGIYSCNYAVFCSFMNAAPHNTTYYWSTSSGDHLFVHPVSAMSMNSVLQSVCIVLSIHVVTRQFFLPLRFSLCMQFTLIFSLQTRLNEENICGPRLQRNRWVQGPTTCHVSLFFSLSSLLLLMQPDWRIGPCFTMQQGSGRRVSEANCWKPLA